MAELLGTKGAASGATPALQLQAEALVRAWVDGPSDTEAAAGLRSALPAGTVVDRVVVEQSVAAAYVQMPAAFLANLTDVQCEGVFREYVALLKQVPGLRAFLMYARPAGGDESAYRCLPDYLPKPPPQATIKPEPETLVLPGELRAGGLPTYDPGQPVGALTGKTVFLSPGHGWVYNSDTGVWGTQRGNTWGLIEDLSNGEAVLNHLARYLHNAGANVWPCRERDFNTNMVIIDNEDGAPAFTVTGTWPTGTAAGAWQGSNYQYHAVSTTETAVATYAPDIPEAGYYSVYIWTPSASNRSTDARVRVNHTGGTTTHVINMQRDGNTYRFLGVYYFNAGRDATRGSVEISNQGSDPSKYVIADAVRFGGGMGDYDDGGGVSGQPRWEESGKYFAVFMGHTTTPNGTVVAMPLYAKWESESWEDSIYFSWHTNAFNGSARGTDMYVYASGQPPGVPGTFDLFDGVAGGDSLANRILDEVINDIHVAWDPSWISRKFGAYFGELNPTYNDEMPACLLEVAFHDNQLDAQSLADPRFRDLVSRAIYQGIVDWWYLDADGPSSTPIPTNTLLPEPPTHLSVRNLGDGTVRVRWHAPPYDTGDSLLGDPATGYRVSTSTDGYGFDDGTATTDTWLDFTGLEPGSIRYFRVVATNAGGYSFPSEIGAARVTTTGTAPILIVNGFDRLNRTMMVVEDDPNSSNDLLRERLFLMNHYGYVRTFAAAIKPLGVAFDFCANETVRDGDLNLIDYDAVIWQSGEESSADATFDATEQGRVAAYLNGGGMLFASGAEIAWDLDFLGNGISFYNDYLKADYSADDAATYAVTAVAGSIFDAVGPFTFDDGSNIYDVDYPDVLNTIGGSTAALSYSGGLGGTAGVTYNGEFRVVNFGFPFETITAPSRRAEIMASIVAFFDLGSNGPAPVEVIVEARDPGGALTPPPAYEETDDWVNNDSVKSAAPGLFGFGSRYNPYVIPNPGTDNATFVPHLLAPGKYEVFVTWGNEANCYNAGFTVQHYHGSTQKLVHQLSDVMGHFSNADEWVSLGEYWFEAGQGESIASVNVTEDTISGQPTMVYPARMYADAAKWTPIRGWPDGDVTGDGQVTLADFATFPDCLSGPGGGYNQPECEDFDFDVDSDVDLDDFRSFQEVFAH